MITRDPYYRPPKTRIPLLPRPLGGSKMYPNSSLDYYGVILRNPGLDLLCGSYQGLGRRVEFVHCLAALWPLLCNLFFLRVRPPKLVPKS